MYFDSPTDEQIDAFEMLSDTVAIDRVQRVTGARFDTFGDAAEMFYSLSPELAARVSRLKGKATMPAPTTARRGRRSAARAAGGLMRRLLPLLLAVAALATIAPAAGAVTLQTADVSHPWQAWADAAQAPTWQGDLPLTTGVGYGGCGPMLQAAGCTTAFPQVDQTTGQILPGPPASISVELALGDPADLEQGYLLHELGHVFDFEYLADADRAAFMAIIGVPGDASRWWYTRQIVVSGVTVTYSPGEWFAESYRMCATFGVNQALDGAANTYEDYGYPGDQARFAARQRQACQLIDSIGRRAGIPTPPQATYPPTSLPGRVIRARVRTRPIARLSHGARRVSLLHRLVVVR